MDMTAYFSKQMILSQAIARVKTRIHFFPEVPGVVLPEGDWRMEGEPTVRLNLSRFFKGIDLVCVPDQPVQANLSFKGSKFRVSIPWEAIVCVDPLDPLFPTIYFPLHPDTVETLNKLDKIAAETQTAPEKKPRPDWLKVVEPPIENPIEGDRNE